MIFTPEFWDDVTTGAMGETRPFLQFLSDEKRKAVRECTRGRLSGELFGLP
jgi:hypothetical protein